MTRVLATGTFDIIHPGHIYFLEQARALGDELWVIVARDSTVRHKPTPVIPERQRLAMVSALRVVDHAVLGDEKDMLAPVERIRPDVIALGHDQYFDEDELRHQLAERGIRARVARIGGKLDGELFSGERIRRRIREHGEENGGQG